MTATTDLFNIDMPSFEYQPANDSSFEMPSFQFDSFGDTGGYSSYDSSSWDQAKDPWDLSSYNDVWATDEELNEVFSPAFSVSEEEEAEGAGGDKDSGFWDGVWDFLSSDGMLNALGGMADLGLDMWRAKTGVSPGGGSSSYGGEDDPVYQKDAGKLTEKPHVFTRK